MKILNITFFIDDQENIWRGQYISKRFFEIEDVEGKFSKTSMIKYLKTENAKNIKFI